MTTMTVLTRPIRETPAPGSGATFPRVARSEWTKLRSLRSTWWTLLGLMAVTIGFSALVSWGESTHFASMSAAEKAAFDPTATSLVGLVFGQLAIAVLGALMVTSEYTTGSIRSTFAAVPRRLRLLSAKALVLVTVALTVGLITCFGSFFVGQAFLSGNAVSAALGDPGVLRAIIGGGLYVAGSAMFGFALGTLLRHGAAAITTVVAALLVMPNLVFLLPGEWGHSIARWFTANAGYQVMVVHPEAGAPSPLAGYLAFTAQWLVLAGVATFLLQRRDA